MLFRILNCKKLQNFLLHVKRGLYLSNSRHLYCIWANFVCILYKEATIPSLRLLIRVLYERSANGMVLQTLHLSKLKSCNFWVCCLPNSSWLYKVVLICGWLCNRLHSCSWYHSFSISEQTHLLSTSRTGLTKHFLPPVVSAKVIYTALRFLFIFYFSFDFVNFILFFLSNYFILILNHLILNNY